MRDIMEKIRTIMELGYDSGYSQDGKVLLSDGRIAIVPVFMLFVYDTPADFSLCVILGKSDFRGDGMEIYSDHDEFSEEEYEDGDGVEDMDDGDVMDRLFNPERLRKKHSRDVAAFMKLNDFLNEKPVDVKILWHLFCKFGESYGEIENFAAFESEVITKAKKITGKRRSKKSVK